jgi:hypothetical protein
LLPTKRQALIVATVVLLLSWLLHLRRARRFPSLSAASGLSAFACCWRIPPPRPCVRRGSRSAARLLAIALMAPLASLTTAFLAQGANVLNYLSETQTLTGHIFMAIVGLVFGLVMSLVAMRSERRQTERADRLQAELEKNRLERELLDARLRLLQSQIEPHFLFNTLANIEALVASGSSNAGPVLRHLIAYLRAAMPRLNDSDATLQTELQLVRTLWN